MCGSVVGSSLLVVTFTNASGNFFPSACARSHVFKAWRHYLADAKNRILAKINDLARH